MLIISTTIHYFKCQSGQNSMNYHFPHCIELNNAGECINCENNPSRCQQCELGYGLLESNQCQKCHLEKVFHQSEYF